MQVASCVQCEHGMGSSREIQRMPAQPPTTNSPFPELTFCLMRRLPYITSPPPASDVLGRCTQDLDPSSPDLVP